MYVVVFGEGVVQSLKNLPASKRGQILGQKAEQLTDEPTRPTRNRKILAGLKPPWHHEAPMWELRVRDYRVFYEVDEGAERVLIHAVRDKPPHKTTEEVL